MAQAPFTIVRPLDGAHVRETIKILIPKGSIPENGYIGVFIDGKFIEAVRPPVVGKYFEYDLDTHARGIEDSPAGKPYKLEVVLFTTYNDQPRIVDRSSVDVYVANKSSIPVPNSGFQLRYKWTPGTDMVYDFSARVLVDAISEDQEKLGGRPAELENVVPITTRLMYAVDRQFPDADGKVRADSDGLVRIQLVPDKGKDYVVVPIEGNDQPEKHYDVDLAPIYMRLTTTGRQIWGTVPELSNSSFLPGHGVEESLFADLPLPTLPVNKVRPGDSWRSRFQDGVPNFLDNIQERNNLVATFPARGEFVGVEWEMGHPCAVLKDTIAASESSDQEKAIEKETGIAPRKIKEEETLWFSLDTHKVLRMDRNIEIDTVGSAAAYGFASGGGGGPAAGGPGQGMPGMGPGRGPGMGPGMGPGRGGPPPGYGGPGAPGGGGRDRDDLYPPNNFMQKGGGRFPGMGPGGPGGGPPPGFGGRGMPGQGMPGEGGGATQANSIVRLTVTETRILEQ